MLPMGGVETHGGGSHGAEAAHHQRKGRHTGGHGKGPPSAVPVGRALSRVEMAGIMAMLAASAHHRAAGFANKISFGVKEVGIWGVWRRI